MIILFNIIKRTQIMKVNYLLNYVLANAITELEWINNNWQHNIHPKQQHFLIIRPQKLRKKPGQYIGQRAITKYEQGQLKTRCKDVHKKITSIIGTFFQHTKSWWLQCLQSKFHSCSRDVLSVPPFVPEAFVNKCGVTSPLQMAAFEARFRSRESSHGQI